MLLKKAVWIERKKKKIDDMFKNNGKIVWVLIVVSFIFLQLYSFYRKNYADLFLTAVIIIIFGISGFIFIQIRKNLKK